MATDIHLHAFFKQYNPLFPIVIELARRMRAMARNSDEHRAGANLLGNALWALGERESSAARLEEAVTAYDAALAVFINAGAERYIQVCQANKNMVALLVRDNRLYALASFMANKRQK